MEKASSGVVRAVHEIAAETVGGARGTTRQVLIGADEAPNFALRRFVMQPGGGMPKHTNSVEHEQYVLGGRASIGIGEDVVDVRAGSVVFIPAGMPHWYRVEGDEPFEFLCAVPNARDEVTVLEEYSAG
ncbi:MAG: cupin domain-containing protein [Gemmatimonadetes bacterium]|nr:cupin domain-containing protein [Gemmatimonadota bacterium]MBA3556048.1 cupin domain-containing protein [Gemmatimonadales bacterium]